MGDRANVYVHHGDQPGVYLYTHWSGFDLPETVRAALERFENRWSDAPYLTRIIFDQMTKGLHGEESGYGISAEIGDGGRQIVDVDTAKQEVTLVVNTRRAASWAFVDYIDRGTAVWSDVVD